MDEYRDDEDLDDFIVSEEEIMDTEKQDGLSESNSPKLDRIAVLTSTLKGHETYTSKVLRAHISVLVSALGGPDHSTEEGLYKLGHDALACLKDLKRWIRSVDEKSSSFDVALACADCGLVTNDLIVILCQWYKPSDKVKRTKSVEKIMLASLELLVLLTWPIDVNRKSPINEYTARSNARRAQLIYKHNILNYKLGLTLKAVISLGLKALTTPREDREPRDVNILRLILFFIRNVLYIEPLPASKSSKGFNNSSDLPNGMNLEDINTSSVLTTFEKHKVLLFLTSIAHSVLSELTDDSFGQVVMECLSLLTKGIDVTSLFSSSPKTSIAKDAARSASEVAPASSAAGLHLQDLLNEETRRKRLQKNTLSTRHGRFGTLLSIRSTDDTGFYTVSGQEALSSTHDTLDKLDRSKKWHRMSNFKYDSNGYFPKSSVILNLSNQLILKSFVNEFLLSGCFNNVLRFVGQILTSVSNEHGLGRAGILEAIDGHELASYFMTVAWFLSYKRERLAHYEQQNKAPLGDEDGLDYGSVGEALSEVNFILLVSYLRSAHDAKDYDSLHVAMTCFREMLLIAHAIFTKARTQREIELESEADVNEDRELAEGIIRKYFSQKHFLDVIIDIPKQASKHSPEYLKVVVSTVHILLKSFESLANEDVKLFIKTRRRISKLNRQGGLNKDMDQQHWHLIDRDSDDEDAEAEMRYIVQERKLDFKNTEVKFFHSDTVSTHIQYLSKFEDLSFEEIKRGISFFHRLFVVRKDFSALYRLDFINTIYRLRHYLPRNSNIRGHVEDFIVYYMKKFKEALDRFPVALELLFPRFENLEIKSYLSTGDLDLSATKTNREMVPSGRSSYFADDAPQPREADLLEFIDNDKLRDEKISIIVYYMMKKSNGPKMLKFIASELARLADLAKSGVLNLKLRLTLANRRLMINDSYLRLLLEVVGFELPYLQNDETNLKQGITAEDLAEAKQLIDLWVERHKGAIGDLEPYLDQIRHTIFTDEQLRFGEQAHSNLRLGAPYDELLASRLNLSNDQVMKVIGLARRKEFNEAFIADQYEVDEDFDPEKDDSPEDDNAHQDDAARPVRKNSKRYLQRQNLSDELDDELPQKSKRGRSRVRMPNLSLDSDDEDDMVAISKSAELVHDSDDDSDDERVQSFYESEEKLRKLIQETGGIQKDQLEIFKESWEKIKSAGSDSQVKDAIHMASKVVAEFDDSPNSDNAMQDDTPFTSASDDLSASESEVVSTRKRILRDEDEEDEPPRKGSHLARKRTKLLDDDNDDIL